MCQESLTLGLIGERGVAQQLESRKEHGTLGVRRLISNQHGLAVNVDRDDAGAQGSVEAMVRTDIRFVADNGCRGRIDHVCRRLRSSAPNQELNRRLEVAPEVNVGERRRNEHRSTRTGKHHREPAHVGESLCRKQTTDHDQGRPRRARQKLLSGHGLHFRGQREDGDLEAVGLFFENASFHWSSSFERTSFIPFSSRIASA